MGMATQEDEDEITGINVTPLVDVMLVLLVIFMVTASYIVHRSIDIKVPKAQTGELKETTMDLEFSLDKNAKLFLEDKPITFDDIAQIIADAKKTRTKVNALIIADAATTHGDVIKLIDRVRKNGVTDFSINVESVEEEK